MFRRQKEPVDARLGALVPAAARLLDEVPEQVLESEDDDAEELIERALAEAAAADPDAAAAWDALAEEWVDAIAKLSGDAELRGRLEPLREPLERLAVAHEGAHWLAVMASVLDREPLLVLEPEHRRGFVGWMSGVVDNFQLHTLLLERLPPVGDERAPVDPEVAAVARGDGPQELDRGVEGGWNLYAWTAVSGSGVLPDPEAEPDDTWVWGEGRPEDIPLFEGRRALLLGPASYVRTWNADRMFPDLRASIEIERELAPEEIDELIGRMAEQAASSAGGAALPDGPAP